MAKYTPCETWYTEQSDGSYVTSATACFSYADGVEETHTYSFDGKLTKEELETKLEETLKSLCEAYKALNEKGEEGGGELRNDAGLDLQVEVEVEEEMSE